MGSGYDAGNFIARPTMNTGELVLATIFVLLALWFFWRNRRELSGPVIVRHVIFIVSIYLGCLSFENGGTLDRWIFGREIYKGDRLEFVAGLLPLVAFLLCISFGVIALGKDRVRHFKLYIKTFGFKKPDAPE